MKAALGFIFLLNPVDKLSTIKTLCPSFTRASAIWEAMNPAPPVTSIFKLFLV
jgi:hypothetical protein